MNILEKQANAHTSTDFSLLFPTFADEFVHISCSLVGAH